MLKTGYSLTEGLILSRGAGDSLICFARKNLEKSIPAEPLLQ